MRAARLAAGRGVGRNRTEAERGVAGEPVAPPLPAAQPGGTPSVTWRPPGSPGVHGRPAAPGGHWGGQDATRSRVDAPRGPGVRLRLPAEHGGKAASCSPRPRDSRASPRGRPRWLIVLSRAEGCMAPTIMYGKLKSCSPLHPPWPCRPSLASDS